MLEIIRKETKVFFSTLTGYIVIAVFLMATGIILWIIPGENNLLDNAYSSLDLFFSLAPWLFLFLVPALTMRLIAEEKRMGTIEYMLTQPISSLQFILGKYFAGLLLVLLSIIPTFIYVFSLYRLGQPVGIIDMGATIGSYIGLIFLAAIYVAIGIFSSSITDNQIIAFIIAALISFLFYMGFDSIGTSLGESSLAEVFFSLGINQHYSSISKGLIELKDIVYYLSSIALFIGATEMIFRSKKNNF
jgi:ABC-2 type transport system permease protein